MRLGNLRLRRIEVILTSPRNESEAVGPEEGFPASGDQQMRKLEIVIKLTK